MTYDVIVVGLGAMGSAATYHLAKDGKRVLGLDRFQPPHSFGSSHGLTRIIREAYFEHSLYVPLVKRAYQLWADLECKSGRQLLLQTGGLMIGPPEGVLVSGAKRSAQEHGLVHENLSATELRQRFPAFQPADEMVAVWEPRAGILFPELAIQTHLEFAAEHGAVLEFNETVLRWEPDGDRVHVLTAGKDYRADRLLLSAGPWMNPLLPDLNLPLSVERQVLCWFEPRLHPEQFEPQRCPIYLWEYERERFFYGFPDLGDGVKVAVHHQGQATEPDVVNREVADSDTGTVREVLAQFLPTAAGRLKSAAVCLYTNTPDEHFILGPHPAHRQVLIASPCSGHGFKFSPVVGEIAAALIDDEAPQFDLALFRPERFQAAGQA